MRANVTDEGVLGIKDATERAEPIKELARSFAATLLDAARGVHFVAAVDGWAETTITALA